jgi:hypothetical protein
MDNQLEAELLASIQAEADRQPAQIETDQEDELLAALNAEAERRIANYQAELKACEADAVPILEALEAVQVNTSPAGAETEDAAPAVPRRSVDEMIWDEVYTELVANKEYRRLLRPQDMARLRAIGERGTPIHGEDKYLAHLLRFVRGEVAQPPGLIGQGVHGQAWGMQGVGWR